MKRAETEPGKKLTRREIARYGTLVLAVTAAVGVGLVLSQDTPLPAKETVLAGQTPTTPKLLDADIILSYQCAQRNLTYAELYLPLEKGQTFQITPDNVFQALGGTDLAVVELTGQLSSFPSGTTFLLESGKYPQRWVIQILPTQDPDYPQFRIAKPCSPRI